MRCQWGVNGRRFSDQKSPRTSWSESVQLVHFANSPGNGFRHASTFALLPFYNKSMSIIAVFTTAFFSFFSSKSFSYDSKCVEMIEFRSNLSQSVVFFCQWQQFLFNLEFKIFKIELFFIDLTFNVKIIELKSN